MFSRSVSHTWNDLSPSLQHPCGRQLGSHREHMPGVADENGPSSTPLGNALNIPSKADAATCWTFAQLEGSISCQDSSFLSCARALSLMRQRASRRQIHLARAGHTPGSARCSGCSRPARRTPTSSALPQIVLTSDQLTSGGQIWKHLTATEMSILS